MVERGFEVSIKSREAGIAVVEISYPGRTPRGWVAQVSQIINAECGDEAKCPHMMAETKVTSSERGEILLVFPSNKPEYRLSVSFQYKCEPSPEADCPVGRSEIWGLPDLVEYLGGDWP